MVICKVCKIEHRSAVPGELDDGTQGVGCACVVFKKDDITYILGHYGSSLYDLDLHKFVECVPEEYVNAEPVCDKCVKYLADYGFIEFVKELGWGDEEI